MKNRIKITVVTTFLMCLVFAMSSFASIAVTISEVDYSGGENFDSTCYREIEEPENYLKVAEYAVKAHVEVYIPETVGMLYYTLSAEELMELKSVLMNTTVKSANPFAADFTTTTHLFREDGSYVFVVAMDGDLQTMHCEAGDVKSDNLRDILVGFKQKTLEGNQDIRPEG